MVKRQVMSYKSVSRLVGNFTSLLTSEVVNRATTFVLYALIARYLGAYELGQLSLALTLFFMSQFIAGAGLKILITREVAKDRTKTGPYLVNGSAIVTVCSLLTITALFIFVRLMNYSPETASIILLLSLGILPFSLSVINKAVFQAWERMYYIAWANVPVNIAKVGLAFILLWQGFGLFELILLLLVSHITILGVEWVLMFRHIIRPRVSIVWHFCKEMIRSTTTFLGINAIVAINASLDILLLSRLTDETQVGLYSAAAQLIAPLIVIYESVIMSVFPEMCKRFTTGIEGLKRISFNVLELLLAITLPIVIGLFFLAEPALTSLYGKEEFVLATPVLRILAFTLILRAFIHVLGRDLVASQREHVTFYIVVLSTLFRLILGLILIIKYGLIGVAAAALATVFVEFLLHYLSVSKSLFHIPVVRLAWRPTVASACMAVYLLLVGYRGSVVTAGYAFLLYAAILFILLVWSNGGPHQFRVKYQYLLYR
ncbi:MAG: flippase [Candidatus Promineifilaceae bacterium]|jgi:O-antigen/teichoic acid export membrane protein